MHGVCGSPLPGAPGGNRARRGAPTDGNDLLEVTLALAAEMLMMAGVTKNVAEAKNILQKKLRAGEALKKFTEMIAAQGGDPQVCEDLNRLPRARHTRPIVAQQSGYVESIACDQIGYAVIALGGGRQVSSDTIDFAVGFENPKKIGDAVALNEPLMLMHYNDEKRASAAERLVQQAYALSAKPVLTRPKLITEKIQ
jgi:pyrimidine-nucleoside phosphorylase